MLDDAAGVLGGLQLEDVRPAKDFDFPTAGTTTATFTSFAGLTLTVDLVDKDGASWARFTGRGQRRRRKAGCRSHPKLSPWIYALSSDKAKTLRDKLVDLVEAHQAVLNARPNWPAARHGAAG